MVRKGGGGERKKEERKKERKKREREKIGRERNGMRCDDGEKTVICREVYKTISW